MKLTRYFLLLCGVISSCYVYCNGLTVYNVASGVYGTKRERVLDCICHPLVPLDLLEHSQLESM